MEPVVTTTGARHGTTADDTGPQTLMMLTATTTTAVQEVITAFAQLASWIMRRDAGGRVHAPAIPSGGGACVACGRRASWTILLQSKRK